MIDLHIHTTYSSDGMHSPADIFAMASGRGITALAFTDHNETGANDEGEALSRETGIAYVRGVEFNSFYNDRDVHILGYFIDHRHPGIAGFVGKVRARKERQTRERCDRLAGMGFAVTMDDVAAEAAGRPATGVSFLKAIMRHGDNLRDERLAPYLTGEKSRSPFMHFYNDFFCPGGHAYVEMRDLPAEEVIGVLRAARGIPVVAHPKNMTAGELCDLRAMGVMGVEVYTSYHDAVTSAFYKKLAEELGLVMTAGSDFHGEKIKKDVVLGGITGNDRLILDGLERRYREVYGTDPYRL